MESRLKITLPSSVIADLLVTQVEVFEATEVDIGLYQEGGRLLHYPHICSTPCPNKKGATLFSTTTLAFLGRFLYFLY